jgi:long-chain acyl-CoA synthetase
MLITEYLERNAILYPDEVALVEINPEYNLSGGAWKELNLVESGPETPFRREISWEDFNCRANRFANLLLANGVGRGDKVAILLMNCLEWLPIYFGVLKAGAMAVPLNYRYSAEEIEYCLDLADASLLVFGPEFEERIDSIKGRLGKIKNMFYVGTNCPDYALSYFKFISYCRSSKPGVTLNAVDDAAIYFSSGTTGFPKAILHNQESLTHAAICEQAHHGQTHDDCFLCIPPLYHTGAKMHWFGSLVAGGKAVLLRGVSPQWILDAASREQASIVWLLVPWAQDILDAIDRGDLDPTAYDLSCWRLMHIGAQPVPPSLIRRWREKFPRHQYDTNYGLSESIGPGCVHLGVDNIHKVGAIGQAGFGWQTRVVDAQGRDVPTDAVGELIVKGPGVMSCYYKDPEATAAVLKDGWLYTGDMAKVDLDGFIFLVDRKKDVIITGGENIYPVQIEDFLRGNDCVKDAAVIGRAHQRLGEIASAIIELKEGANCSAEDIENFCNALPRYKRPREIIFDRIPRNPTGKIEKVKLRQKYGALDLVAQQTGK